MGASHNRFNVARYTRRCHHAFPNATLIVILSLICVDSVDALFPVRAVLR